MSRLLVLGSANLDLSVRVPHIAAPGETVLGADALETPGGKGANTAVAAARALHGLSSTVCFAGAVGRDAYGQTLRASLEASLVNTAHLLELNAPSGLAFIGVADSGENAITVASGANAHLRPEHVPPLTGFSHLALQLETPLETVLHAAQAAHTSGVRVVLNAAPARALPGALLEHVHTLVVNRGELAVLSQSDELERGVQRLLERGPEAVVVTLGGEGVCARTKDGLELRLPAHPVTVVDTTGAGDTFVGAMVARLSEGKALEEALRFAGAAAALACTRPGAQAAMPWREETLALLERA